MDAEKWLKFWANVDKGPSCWFWTSADNYEYGILRIGSRIRLAHRMAYEICIGHIQRGRQLHHTCKNTLCVNPGHLVSMTPADHARIDKSKSVCIRGHARTPENMWRNQCRACHAIHEADRRRRHVHLMSGKLTKPLTTEQILGMEPR